MSGKRAYRKAQDPLQHYYCYWSCGCLAARGPCALGFGGLGLRGLGLSGLGP